MAKLPKWEEATSEFLDSTYRLKVDGGYIYKEGNGGSSVALVFVPSPPISVSVSEKIKPQKSIRGAK